MKRTQVYLPQDLYASLVTISNGRKISVAQVIREALSKYLKEGAATGVDSLLEVAGLNITGGPQDLSKNFNRYLYGDE